MSEYINKADLYNEVAKLEELARDRYLDTPWDSPARTRYQSQLNELANLKHLVEGFPVADVAEVRHGRWIDEDFPEKMATVHGFAICSICGELSHKAEHGYNILSNYCPNCGARMDKEDEK